MFVPAVVGLALSSSLLIGPPAQAAPVAAPSVASFTLPLASVGAVALNKGATIAVNPVANGGSVVVDFSKSATKNKRPVVLQLKQADGSWVDLARTKMNSKGVATFKRAIGDTDVYRAVAEVYKKKPEVATPEKSSAWTLARNYEFDGSVEGKDAEWTYRVQGFNAYGRNCASPLDANTNLTGGIATLKITRGDAADIEAAKAAGCNTSKYSVYRNAMASTEGNFTIKSGILAAKVKFPLVRGLHNGVWLRSSGSGATSEIDMVEAYGYPKGRGITHAWHYYGANGSRAIKEYKKIGSKSRSWWNAWHTYSVEFSPSKLVFRIDGVVTKSVSRGGSYYPPSDSEYFLVMSALTSEFDQNNHKISNSEIGATTTSIDWVKVWATK